MRNKTVSIETKIEELTGAITALNVTISALVNDANFGKIAAPSTAASTAAVAGATEEKPKRTRTTKPAEPKPVETADSVGFDDDVVESIDAATAAGTDNEFDLGIDEEPAVEVTQADLKTVVSDVSKKKGRETVLRLFKDFSVATFGDVKPEQYGKMYAAAKELLG